MEVARARRAGQASCRTACERFITQNPSPGLLGKPGIKPNKTHRPIGKLRGCTLTIDSGLFATYLSHDLIEDDGAVRKRHHVKRQSINTAQQRLCAEQCIQEPAAGIAAAFVAEWVAIVIDGHPSIVHGRAVHTAWWMHHGDMTSRPACGECAAQILTAPLAPLPQLRVSEHVRTRSGNIARKEYDSGNRLL